VGFDYAAELAFPTAVEDGVVDVAAVRAGFPAVGFGGRETDVAGGAGWVVGIEDGFDGVFTNERAFYGGGDFGAGERTDFGVFELRRESSALTFEIAVIEPLPGDALEFEEEVGFGIGAGFAPFVE
jgi:hypothetical protein